MSNMLSVLNAEDLAALRRAHAALEDPSLAARLSNVLGIPIAQGLKLLPQRWYAAIQRGAERAVGRALTLAIDSLGRNPPSGDHDRFHRLMAMATGAAGGWLGVPALLVELPVTTAIMLRAIADTAHRHGEDLANIETRLACMEVFALGGRSHEDDFTEIGYYEVRTALAFQFNAIGREALAHGLPAPIGLIRVIAGRFGIVVSDMAAARLVPVLGAAAGATVNVLFMQHFQTVAEGHFTIRQLERRYGEGAIAAAYDALTREAEEAAMKVVATAVAA